MQLTGKRIIVTGGAQGIGASIVRKYAEEGALVASLDIVDELGDKVANEASQRGPGNVRFYYCDITSRSGVQEAFKSSVGQMGGLDAMVNAAGIMRSARAEEIADEDWDLIFKVNVNGTLYTNQSAFQYLHTNGGRIINFASVAGVRGLPNAAHYSASKGAVLSWTRTIAQEWGKYDITVNAMVPAMRTPMFDKHRSLMSTEAIAAHDAKLASMIPIGGRVGDPDRDLAPIMVFLVSEGARFITGQTIAVDGGQVMVS